MKVVNYYVFEPINDFTTFHVLCMINFTNSGGTFCRSFLARTSMPINLKCSVSTNGTLVGSNDLNTYAHESLAILPFPSL